MVKGVYDYDQFGRYYIIKILVMPRIVFATQTITQIFKRKIIFGIQIDIVGR